MDVGDEPQLGRTDLATLLDRIVVDSADALLRRIPDASVHLIASDIPYGIGADEWDVLHRNTNSALLGESPAQRNAGAVFKRRGKPLNGWSEADRRIPHEYHDWCASWASEWLRVLKPGASAFVFAGRRLQHRCVSALEDAGFTFKDMIAWERPRAVHRAQRVSIVFERRDDRANAEKWQGWRVGNLRPTFEPVLWFVKPYKIGTTIASNLVDHEVGGFNEDAYRRNVGHCDNYLAIGFEPGEAGLHPTQKPVKLMEALISLGSAPQQVVLDPFSGSGSTFVAAHRLGRRFIGAEINADYVEIARQRIAREPLRLAAAV